VPVLDLRPVLGWPAPRAPGQVVALLMSEAVDLVRLERTALSPLGALMTRRPDLLRASVSVPGRGEHLVLDVRGLQQDVEIQALSSLNVRIVQAGTTDGLRAAGPAATSSAGTAARGRSVLCFDAAVEYACDLGQVEEVLEMPAGWISAPGAHAAVLGFFSHRGRTLPLVCLSRVLDGHPPASEAERRVLLVGHRHGTVGFLVSRVNNIEVTRWERTSGGSGAAGRAQGPQARALDAMVEVGDGDHKRTLRRVDLRAIADGLAGRPDGADRDRLTGASASRHVGACRADATR